MAAEITVRRQRSVARRDAERVDRVAEDALGRIKRAAERIEASASRMTRLYQERLDGQVRE